MAPAVEQLLLQIGARIRVLRTRAGISQEEAASRAGVDYKRWQRIEAGQVNATVRTLARVATAIGVTFADLVTVHRSSQRR